MTTQGKKAEEWTRHGQNVKRILHTLRRPGLEAKQVLTVKSHVFSKHISEITHHEYMQQNPSFDSPPMLYVPQPFGSARQARAQSTSNRISASHKAKFSNAHKTPNAWQVPPQIVLMNQLHSLPYPCHKLTKPRKLLLPRRSIRIPYLSKTHPIPPGRRITLLFPPMPKAQS